MGTKTITTTIERMKILKKSCANFLYSNVGVNGLLP